MAASPLALESVAEKKEFQLSEMELESAGNGSYLTQLLHFIAPCTYYTEERRTDKKVKIFYAHRELWEELSKNAKNSYFMKEGQFDLKGFDEIKKMNSEQRKLLEERYEKEKQNKEPSFAIKMLRFELAICYIYGYGGKAKPRRGYEILYRLRRFPPAAHMLGNLYWQGVKFVTLRRKKRVTEKEMYRKMAYEYFFRAAGYNFPVAFTSLAICFMEDKGIPVKFSDPKKKSGENAQTMKDLRSEMAEVLKSHDTLVNPANRGTQFQHFCLSKMKSLVARLTEQEQNTTNLLLLKIKELESKIHEKNSRLHELNVPVNLDNCEVEVLDQELLSESNSASMVSENVDEQLRELKSEEETLKYQQILAYHQYIKILQQELMMLSEALRKAEDEALMNQVERSNGNGFLPAFTNSQNAEKASRKRKTPDLQSPAAEGQSEKQSEEQPEEQLEKQSPQKKPRLGAGERTTGE